ncbi:MAG: hypothetical protein ABIM30_01180 [candidate division WOR-3 bacterium]
MKPAKTLGRNFHKILELVKKPEDILNLSKSEQNLYREALDAVYGPKEQRIKDLGFKAVTEIQNTSSPYKFTDNPDLIKYLQSTGKKGDEIYVKDLDKALNINDPNVLQRLQEGESKQIIGGRRFQEKLDDLAKTENKPIYNPDAKAYRVVEDGTITRDKDAFFDPRFKDSKHKLAGAVGMTQVPDMSPIPMLQEGVKKYDEIKNKVMDKLAGELNLSKNEQDKDSIKEVLSNTLDPVEFTPFGILVDLIRNSK